MNTVHTEGAGLVFHIQIASSFVLFTSEGFVKQFQTMKSLD